MSTVSDSTTVSSEKHDTDSAIIKANETRKFKLLINTLWLNEI